MGEDGRRRVGEVRAGTTSSMPDHKGFKLQKLVNFQKFRVLRVTVNQQILAAIKFGISQNKVIWQLLNLASPRGPSMQCTINVYVGGYKY